MSHLLLEKISDTKLLRKVLRSLPQRFSMKVTVIEKANDVTTMKLNELFTSLTIIKLNLGDGDPKCKSMVDF